MSDASEYIRCEELTRKIIKEIDESKCSVKEALSCIGSIKENKLNEKSS